jgi:hypothetical protein
MKEPCEYAQTTQSEACRSQIDESKKPRVRSDLQMAGHLPIGPNGAVPGFAEQWTSHMRCYPRLCLSDNR